MKRQKQRKVYWYSSCDNCGFNTGAAVASESGAKRCWKCGSRIYVDYKKTNEMKIQNPTLRNKTRNNEE